MKFGNINPYIRFAAQIMLFPQNEVICSSDCRIFMFLKGKGQIQVNDDKYDLTENLLMLWQPGTPYRFICKNPVVVISINFDYSRQNCEIADPFPIVRYDEFENKTYDRVVFEDFPLFNFPVLIPNASSVCKRIKELPDQFISKRFLSEEKSGTVLKKCLLDIAEILYSPSVSSSGAIKLSQAINYINNNYQNDINNDSIARNTGYHPYYLNSIFKKTTGISIHKYLNTCRIEAAEKLLISTNLPITVVATQTGYNSCISFTQNFKKIHAITPSEFRHRCRSLV